MIIIIFQIGISQLKKIKTPWRKKNNKRMKWLLKDICHTLKRFNLMVDNVQKLWRSFTFKEIKKIFNCFYKPLTTDTWRMKIIFYFNPWLNLNHKLFEFFKSFSTKKNNYELYIKDILALNKRVTVLGDLNLVLKAYRTLKIYNAPMWRLCENGGKGDKWKLTIQCVLPKQLEIVLFHWAPLYIPVSLCKLFRKR